LIEKEGHFARGPVLQATQRENSEDSTTLFSTVPRGYRVPTRWKLNLFLLWGGGNDMEEHRGTKRDRKDHKTHPASKHIDPGEGHILKERKLSPNKTKKGSITGDIFQSKPKPEQREACSGPYRK